MIYKNKNIIIPKWISFRTYFFGQEDSRTYISNERKHAYILLENLASDMWYLIYQNISQKEFEEWAKTNYVSEQVDDFLNDLLQQDLILYNAEEFLENGEYIELESDTQNNEEAKFIGDMKSWLFGKKFMFSLFFELTYRCNLKCVHCYNPKDMSSVEMDFEQCKKIIDDAYNMGCFRVTFSGGESTLYSKFIELVKYARSKHLSVEIFTNGQMLADNKKLYNEVLAEYPYRVCVSLYGVDKTIHEKVTAIDGSFEKTNSLIKQLRKDNVNVQIKNFLLNINCDDCIKVKNFAKSIKATSLADISLIPTIKGNKSTLQYVLDEKTLFRLYTDKQSPLFIGEDYEPIDYTKRMEYSPCYGGFSSLCVTPNMDVTICVSMPQSLGNLNNTSIKEIWEKATEKDENSKLYQWQQIKLKDFEECFKEEYCRFCSYCPGMGYLENGYLKKSNVLCAQAKAKMKAYNYLRNKK